MSKGKCLVTFRTFSLEIEFEPGVTLGEVLDAIPKSMLDNMNDAFLLNLEVVSVRRGRDSVFVSREQPVVDGDHILVLLGEFKETGMQPV